MVNYKRNQGKPQKPKACRGITIRRKEKLMKKLTALFLSLAMIFATISLTAVPVSAASNNGGWDEILSCSETGERKQDVVRSIKIYKKDKPTLLSYKSALKIVTTEQISGRTITKTYETQMYTPWYYFTTTPLTAREICEKDEKLRKSEIFSVIEHLSIYLDIAENPGNLLGASLEYQNDYNEGVISLLQDTPDAKSIVFNRCKSLLGIETPLIDFISDSKDLINDANEARSFAEKMKNNLWKCFALMTLEIDSAHVQNSINENINLFFNKFDGIGK